MKIIKKKKKKWGLNWDWKRSRKLVGERRWEAKQELTSHDASSKSGSAAFWWDEERVSCWNAICGFCFWVVSLSMCKVHSEFSSRWWCRDGGAISLLPYSMKPQREKSPQELDLNNCLFASFLMDKENQVIHLISLSSAGAWKLRDGSEPALK